MAVAKKTESTGFISNFTNKFKARTVFFREVWNELKKVHWPTRKQMMVYTGVVFVTVGIFAVLIWIVDSMLTFSLTSILK
ncbi:preprotein translocase, SecE subunit [Syntrophobotulus glycolicus DSM 8271]|uniref:Protein translocase subunit SecE n=1 Tax=Syntrophobotulus glycolicus (strain DSM 8271 / FlGlyR) TaxID=645991 RepID=F0SXZ4_SYNGF|nr:preprotein translocase subunit SecE [Syntrophobotulus glycolicus]ADY54744.1 preprotein translocase, SecE subunit [Syntrophobotulus glycolicus DSM 8271]